MHDEEVDLAWCVSGCGKWGGWGLVVCGNVLFQSFGFAEAASERSEVTGPDRVSADGV
jgi:hypothetical protein